MARPRGLVQARGVQMGKIPGAVTLFRTITAVASIWVMTLPALGQNGLAVAHFWTCWVWIHRVLTGSTHLF